MDGAVKQSVAQAENPGSTFERLGLGVGLRNSHFDHILKAWPEVDWFEAISENFMDSGGRPRWVLDQIKERYPIVLHGVSMSIGSTDPLDRAYLAKLKALADDVKARWVSDHLCWTGIMGLNSHDLLPLMLTEEALTHVAARVRIVQDVLERPLVLENPSSYVQFQQSTISEPDFLRALCDQTGCKLLLDVNNVYVTCFNAGTSTDDYMKAFPFEHVVQMHLAGHQHCGTHIVDTHDGPVCDEVWQLFRAAWQKTGGASPLLEWDGDVPEFDRVHAEVLRARAYIDGIDPVEAVATRSRTSAATSTPVDFMVPNVMGDSRMQTL
ncbi:DUF692 domain-containing protein [Kordiimonas lacus]|uniref:Uncharacterized protein n=1 Tax=Kordiimonas lacus TaxID=637679 RepID=A0A1G6T008_9PROT|nr:DUF692 domain-containing protein [Kordiimonas lacus]SDD21836.1 hypothetical protein SAMN04488071_0039 [Kordiimonas lacus]